MIAAYKLNVPVHRVRVAVVVCDGQNCAVLNAWRLKLVHDDGTARSASISEVPMIGHDFTVRIV